MKELNSLIQQASKLIEFMTHGKTLPSEYVVQRFDAAMAENPQDQLIGNMRDVLAKQASQRSLISQKEIARVYDQMVGLAGGRTEAFRASLSDLLPSDHGVVKSAQKDYSTKRANEEVQLSPTGKETDLSKAMGSIFSIDGKPSLGYAEGLDKKAEKYVDMQLKTLGCPAQSIKAVRGNEHFILCVATYDMPNFSKVDVGIPVQITSGNPTLPESFVQDQGLSALTKENLLVHIKDEGNHKHVIAQGKFASERGDGSAPVSANRVVVPASLQAFADLETKLLIATSKFTHNEVVTASNTLAAGLTSIGVSGVQMKVHVTDDRSITFKAQVQTSAGPANIYVPIEMHDGRALLPSKFASDPNTSAVGVYDFNQAGMTQFLRSTQNTTQGVVNRHTGSMDTMSYHELMDKVIEGVHTKDYVIANDALQVIQAKYEPNQYQFALDKFAKMLKHTSEGTDRHKMIEASLKSGDLIRVPTSLEPYCPKLGLPVSKIDFDDRGRPIPLRRKAQAENSSESQTYLSSNKIYLS